MTARVMPGRERPRRAVHRVGPKRHRDRVRLGGLGPYLPSASASRGTRWAWPLYFLSSLLYGWLFTEVDLFASAATQLIFMAAAIWGLVLLG